MKKVLAVDAVSMSVSCAVIIDDELICDFTVNNKKTHSQGLMPLIDRALDFSDIDINDVDEIVCSNGPGSFTGLRIVLSTVKGLAHFRNIPIFSVSSLRALSLHDLNSKGAICPIMDARREQVYSALYYKNEQVLPEDTWNIHALLEHIGGKNTLFVGDGIKKYRDLITSASSNYVVGDLKHATNPALGVYRAYRAGFAVQEAYDDLSVNYLRVPEAQRNLEAAKLL